MNELETRELDAWICQHVLGWMKCEGFHLDRAGWFAVNNLGEVYIHDRGSKRGFCRRSTSPDRNSLAEQVLRFSTPQPNTRIDNTMTPKTQAGGSSDMSSTRMERLPPNSLCRWTVHNAGIRLITFDLTQVDMRLQMEVVKEACEKRS